MSTTTTEPLTLGDIDQVLTHWATKLRTDPDPLNRWGHLETCDAWLDTRNALTKGHDQLPVE